MTNQGAVFLTQLYFKGFGRTMSRTKSDAAEKTDLVTENGENEEISDLPAKNDLEPKCQTATEEDFESAE